MKSEIMQEIEIEENSIKVSKEKIQTGEALERLIRNKDFQLIIEKGFIEDEAIRMSHLLTATIDPNQRANLTANLQAPGLLRSYLNLLRASAMNAVNDLRNSERTLDELRQEALNEDVESDVDEDGFERGED